MYLQLRIFNSEYSTERICAAVGDMPIFACVLYCKFCAKYRAHPPVCAMWTVVPDIYNAFTAQHIQDLIFNWTHLRWYWRYVANTMRLILQTLCQIQRSSTRLLYLTCGPGHTQSNYISKYSGCNILLNMSALVLEICRQRNARYTANMVPNTALTLQFSLSGLWSRPYTM
jgi:hypothetical protein